MKKKWVCVILFCALCMGLCGCGTKSSSAKEVQYENEKKDDLEDTSKEDNSGKESSLEKADESKDTSKVQNGTQDITEKAEQTDSRTGESVDDGTVEAEDSLEPDEVEAEPEEEESSKVKISILGDSISTFNDWIPYGYNGFFPGNGLVHNVEETWWSIVLRDLDLELYKNGSSSGCTVTGDSLSTTDVQSGCSNLRINDLTSEKGKKPDIIIVYMGANDLLKNAPMGANDGNTPVQEGVIVNFTDAYTLILDKLRAAYPNAKIYCCTLLPISFPWESEAPALVKNGNGFTTEDYSNSIRTIALNKGCGVIELTNCGVTLENILEMTSDGVHPTPAGMKCIAEAVKACIR